MSIGMTLEEAMKTIKFQNEYIMQLSKEKCALQAKIDSLMLEYCPEEMEQEQIERWQEYMYLYNKGPCEEEKIDAIFALYGLVIDKETGRVSSLK